MLTLTNVQIAELEWYWHWVIGYWAISADIGYDCYWGIFFSLWHPIRYRSDSSQHRPHNNHLDICSAAVVIRRQQGEWGGVECKLYIVIIIIQFWDFTWYSVVYISLQNQYIAMLHSSICIGVGYWYHYRPILLDIGCWVPCLVSF